MSSTILSDIREPLAIALAGGGQIEGVDFTATPFRMGRSLYNKCVGLLGSYIDPEGMCQ